MQEPVINCRAGCSITLTAPFADNTKQSSKNCGDRP